MHSFQPNLLRRTAIFMAAAAGLLAFQTSEAAVVTLTGTSGSSCSYSSMSVAPDGSFNVVCTTSTTPPPTTGTDAGVFAFASPSGTVAIGALGFYPVARTVGTVGAVTMNYQVSGAGCTNGVGTLNFADGDTSQSAVVRGLLDGICTLTLQQPTTTSAVNNGPRLGSPSTFNVTVGTGGGQTAPPPQPPIDTTSCPAGYTPPSGLTTMTLGGFGNPIMAMASSNQVVSMTLPNVPAGSSTGQITFSESAGGAYTPQPVLLNITISKCKGYIDTDYTNRCNLQSSNGNYNSISWFAQAYSVIKDAASANLRGYCWAPASEGTWYVNSKWSYTQCAFGAQICGFAVQQNPGPY